MRITSFYAAMVLENKNGYLGPGHIKHGWIRKLFDAAQDTDEIYKLKITIMGDVVFEKSCPLTIVGFTISKSLVIIHVKGRESPRIKDKWTRISEERFNVPVTLVWVKEND